MLQAYPKSVSFWFRNLILLLILLTGGLNAFSHPLNAMVQVDSKHEFIENARLVPPTITLTAIPYQSRIAQLSWTTSDATVAGTYYIERDTSSSGNWTVISVMPYNAVLQYSDTITYPFCAATNFSYQIRFETTLTAETGFSNISNLVLWDQTKPEGVRDIIVSITSTRLPVISWIPATGNDIFGYEIQRFTGSSWPPITTLPADSNTYIDKTITDACNKSYSYEIVAIDQCNNRRPPAYVPLKQTISLQLQAIGECEKLAKLSWNTYNLMPGGLGGYRVYRMVDYANPTLVKTITDTLATSYDDAFQFENGRYYTYFVEAYSAKGTGISSSCQQTRKFTGAGIPDSIYISKVSVESDSYVQISYMSSPDSTIKKLILERSIDGGATFQAIDSLSYLGDFVPKDFQLNDTTADVHSQSYSYRLVAFDYCGTYQIISNISQSIFLQCTPAPTENTLNWNDYSTWMQGVEGYKVYRTIEGQPVGGEMLQSVTPSTLTFPDYLTGIDPNKEACYWITASENPGNPYLNNVISVSNTCCVIKGATLFMPNAFHPGGNNSRFRPVASYVDPQSFKMIIFNRWGQQLFETKDMVNGWNGLVNGQLVPPGVYAYIITYTSSRGQDYTKRGTVFVLR